MSTPLQLSEPAPICNHKLHTKNQNNHNIAWCRSPSIYTLRIFWALIPIWCGEHNGNIKGSPIKSNFSFCIHLLCCQCITVNTFTTHSINSLTIWIASNPDCTYKFFEQFISATLSNKITHRSFFATKHSLFRRWWCSKTFANLNSSKASYSVPPNLINQSKPVTVFMTEMNKWKHIKLQKNTFLLNSNLNTHVIQMTTSKNGSLVRNQRAQKLS